MTDNNIYHTTGYKDDYRVTVDVETPWHPTNDEIFRLIKLWFEAEDASFSDGYGRLMPFFYICLIAIGEEEKAMEAIDEEGAEAVRHFHRVADEHADDVVDQIEEYILDDRKI